MLEVYSTNLAATQNTNIAFNSTNLQTNPTSELVNSTSVQLNAPGIYEINVNATSTAETAIGLQLYADGNALPFAASTGIGAVAFNALVPVHVAVSGRASVSLMYTGASATLSLVHMTVVRRA